MELKRRDFIKSSVIAGFGTTLSPNFEFRNEKQPVKKKIIIAGAGITGLCCTYELMKSGHEVTVLKAGGRHGGHVFTGRDGLRMGYYADFGTDHIIKPGFPMEEFTLQEHTQIT